MVNLKTGFATGLLALGGAGAAWRTLSGPSTPLQTEALAPPKAEGDSAEEKVNQEEVSPLIEAKGLTLDPRTTIESISLPSIEGLETQEIPIPQVDPSYTLSPEEIAEQEAGHARAIDFLDEHLTELADAINSQVSMGDIQPLRLYEHQPSEGVFEARRFVLDGNHSNQKEIPGFYWRENKGATWYEYSMPLNPEGRKFVAAFEAYLDADGDLDPGKAAAFRHYYEQYDLANPQQN